MDRLQKYIFYSFCLLFFVTPLILWPKTSEVFEFNKMLFVYLVTTLIVCLWAIRMVVKEKFIFSRTILDIPLLIYLGVTTLSTLLSIDPLTSMLGYYSRFNGGLVSIISYCLLYWAYVSNVKKIQGQTIIKWLLASALIVCLYGILQHFGIDRNIWVQDVQNRIFSTLGQPNWLAAFLLGVIPIIFTAGFIKKPYSYVLSGIFFVTILFTKSRSGLLGFTAAFLFYWLIQLWRQKSKIIGSFVSFSIIFLALYLLIGNPYLKAAPPALQSEVQSTSLESGGTESGQIRKIVWRGAIDVWKHYPIFGSGPETFAYSYYTFRPSEHNLTSEWDFIYNKAHNEYLNHLATTGALGLLAYLIFQGTALYILVKRGRVELAAGFLGISVSNFFGFSVVPTQLLLFLFPAIANSE